MCGKKVSASFVVRFCGLRSNTMAAELKEKMAYNGDAETVLTRWLIMAIWKQL